MSQSELPEGVPPTNKILADETLVNEKPRFTATEMASPAFLSAPRPGLTAKGIPEQQGFVAQTADDDMTRGAGGEANRSPKIQPGPMFIMIMLAGLLTALAAIIIANARAPLPLCSDQPSWNQHNCRAG